MRINGPSRSARSRPPAPVARPCRCATAIGLLSLAVSCVGNGPAFASAGAAEGGGLRFDPDTISYVDMGAVPGLGLCAFTLEAWFRIEGALDVTTTGYAWGAWLAPIVAKGRHDGSDGTPLDLNYALGIGYGYRVVLDFEDEVSGANLALLSETPASFGQWHHVAATYDGVVARLYLDGDLDAWSQADVNPRSDSVQSFTVGSALDFAGQPDGFFHGLIDEVRVWDHARSEAEIRASINDEIVSAPGLVGRWGMNETSGPDVLDSSGSGHHGVNSSAVPSAGAPFDIDLSPEAPLLSGPGATVAVDETTLRVIVDDPEGAPMTVEFFGRPRQPPREDAFTIVVLPDTQSYLEYDLAHVFDAQTQWAVDHHVSDNVALVAHVGDIINTDTEQQWIEADEAISILETIPELPYVLSPGNHDQSPFGEPTGTAAFNQYFPYTRYEGVVPWYGGHHGVDNDNCYVLFSAGGDDYIAVTVEYNAHQDAIDWADGVLQAHPDRRAIVVSHSIIHAGTQPIFSFPQLWETVKDNPNLFLMLCGHVYGEGHRVEVVDGNVIHILMADFQHRRNGGNGFMRLVELAPGDDAIHVRTWSPELEQFEMDRDSEFWLNEPEPGGPYASLGVAANVGDGQEAVATWSGLEDDRTYEWYVTVTDGQRTVVGPTWSFDVQVAPEPVPGDFDGDGAVGFSDLNVLLDAWGPCPGCAADLDGDGGVGFADLTILLGAWGTG